MVASCTDSTDDAVELDFTVGDQCFFSVAQRPDDCFQYDPCIYSDADIRLARDADGQVFMDVIPGGWTGTTRDSSRVVRLAAALPETLAERVPEALSALGEQNTQVSGSCFFLNPDQSIPFGDVVAFHRALERQDARRVGYYAVLAE